MKYTELALKLVDKFADGKPRYLADICTDITADSIYVLRAVAEIDQKFAKVIIPKDYDARKGPMIAISPDAAGADRSILFGEPEEEPPALPDMAGFNFMAIGDEVGHGQHGDEDENPEGAEAFFQGMAQDIHMMVMLEVMCHQISTSAMWMMSAAESGAFAEEGATVLDAARKIMAAVGQVKG